jgi:2-hydroxy-3-oxopropionate reductase
MNVGFIGLGIMGRPMAGHLISAGHRLAIAKHRSSLPPEFLAQGAVECASAREVAEQSDVVILMVPDTPTWNRSCSGPPALRRA